MMATAPTDGIPADIAETLKRIKSKSFRKAAKRKDRIAMIREVEKVMGRLAATCPTAAWAEWVASKSNATLWPIPGMVLCQGLIDYLGRKSRRFTPAICANVEDMLDLMTPKEADRYRHPSSCGSVVTWAAHKNGYQTQDVD